LLTVCVSPILYIADAGDRVGACACESWMLAFCSWRDRYAFADVIQASARNNLVVSHWGGGRENLEVSLNTSGKVPTSEASIVDLVSCPSRLFQCVRRSRRSVELLDCSSSNLTHVLLISWYLLLCIWSALRKSSSYICPCLPVPRSGKEVYHLSGFSCAIKGCILKNKRSRK
jgi:hypothetical protein